MTDDLKHFRGRGSWPRKREFVWMAIAALLLAHWTVLGALDLQARSVTDRLVEEEGARRASADRVPPDLFVDDPRELPQRKLSQPLGCLPPQGEWLLQWGDGNLPGKVRATALRCVNADLRRSHHAP